MGLTGERTTGRDAARKRAAVEIVARYEPALKRTARRFSLCADDAEDAYQRALEILLTKAPTTDTPALIRWTQTVTKHEALALRQSRERLLGRSGRRRQGSEETVDWVALVPAAGDGPDEQAERREAIARSREALQALRPAERRALSLLAGGCSYAEIGRITGFSSTKVNRSIAEGRERFRVLLSRGEDGSRCGELRPLLSAFCDGEASPAETTALREHLRACGPCRATMRAYRTTPRAVAALAPAPFVAQSLLERMRELVVGAKGTGMAKGLAICVSAAGGAACVATGIVPGPFGGSPADTVRPAREAAAFEPAPAARPRSKPQPRRQPKRIEGEAKAVEPAPGAAPAEAVEYTPPPPAPEPAPAPAPPPEAVPPSSSSGGAAGEFGP